MPILHLYERLLGIRLLWELQERNRSAEKAASDLANGDWNQVVRGRLVGFVDFSERGSAGHIQDRLRWEPYEELI